MSGVRIDHMVLRAMAQLFYLRFICALQKKRAPFLFQSYVVQIERALFHALFRLPASKSHSRAPCADVDERDLSSFVMAVDDAAEEKRMHFGRLIAPGDDNIGCVEIIKTTGWLVDAVGGDESGYGRCHATAGIRVDMIRGYLALHEFLRGVSFPQNEIFIVFSGSGQLFFA